MNNQQSRESSPIRRNLCANQTLRKTNPPAISTRGEEVLSLVPKGIGGQQNGLDDLLQGLMHVSKRRVNFVEMA